MKNLCLGLRLGMLSMILVTFSGISPKNGHAEENVRLKTEFQDTQPKFIKNPDGTFAGLSVELLRLIEKNSKYRFDAPAEFIPNKRIYQNLTQGTTDIHFGLDRNEEREKIYQFGESVYPVKHLVAIRADDPVMVSNFDDIRKLGKEGIILTPKGTSTYSYLLGQEGLKVDDGGKNPDANFEKLANGRGRFFYYHDLGLLYEINQPANKGKFKALPTAFREYAHWMVFSKKVDAAIVEDLSRIMRDLKKTSEYQAIIDQHLRIE